MASQEELRLEQLPNNSAVALTVNDGDESLPPADRGLRAWLILIACFVLESIVWAFPFSFGVFVNYYTSNGLFADGSAAQLNAIGTTAAGLQYFSAPVYSVLLKRWPHYRQTAAITGLVVMIGSIVAASFATTVWQLFITEGVLYAVGGGCTFFAALNMLDEWWINRKGFAYGITIAGIGVGGTLNPLILQRLLEAYGWRTTLRAYAVGITVLISPFFYFLRPRTSSTHQRTMNVLRSMQFVGTRAFWVIQIGNVLNSLGYFLPSLWLPSYASRIGLSYLSGALAVAFLNGAQVPGSVLAGWLMDRGVQATTVQTISAVGSAASVFLLWGFTTSSATLYIFALSYGFLVGGFSTTWTGCASIIRKQVSESLAASIDSATVFATFAAGKGIGAIASGPLSGSLINYMDNLSKHGAKGAYGTGYGNLIIFTGVTLMLGGLCWPGKKIGWL